jgi:hypothetical protein
MNSKANTSRLLARIRAALTRRAATTPRDPATGRAGSRSSSPRARAAQDQTGIPATARTQRHIHAEPTITLDPTLAQRQRDQWAAHARTEATGD